MTRDSLKRRRVGLHAVVGAAMLLTALLAAGPGLGLSLVRAAGSAPATIPAAALDAIVKDLASDNFQVRESAQKRLDEVPVAQYAELTARAEATGDPEVKARLLLRVEKLAVLVEAAGGEAGAVIKVARLLAMPSSAEDPNGTMNVKRFQLIAEIGKLGDVAIKPLQNALGKAQTADQRREIPMALGAVRTAAGTRALLDLLSEKNDAIRRQAISSLADRVGLAPEQGGSDAIVPAVAKVLPDEKDDAVRWQVCAGMVRAVKPIPPADKPAAKLLEQVTELLRERLKNDGSAKVRMWAAITLSEIGDNSGLAELEKAMLAMQSGQAAEYNEASLGLPLHRLIPALERATGQNFGPVPLDPALSSDSNAGPTLIAQRQSLLDTVAQWIKTNSAVPAGTATLPAATGQAGGG